MKKILLSSTAALTLLAIGTSAAFAEGGQRRGGPERPSFEQLDTNGDGVITLEEIQAKAGDKFAESDTNGDGLLDVAELTAAAERERSQMIERMMEKKDTNGDGMLSQEEMAPRNPERLFERADTDGNGAISLEEWEAAKKNMRGPRGGHGSDNN
jgi:Ca2+-binding EF-hand superfamily protein